MADLDYEQVIAKLKASHDEEAIAKVTASRYKELRRVAEHGEEVYFFTPYLGESIGRFRVAEKPGKLASFIAKFGQCQAWEHSEHTYGHIEPIEPGTHKLVDIKYAGDIPADPQLKGAQIMITLDRLRVADYPGGGKTHRILFNFFATHQGPAAVEEMYFNQTFDAREGDHAALIGLPIFDGLTVSKNGLVLQCRTVRTTNPDDQRLLDWLKKNAIQGGLKLLSTVQPVLAPFCSIAESLWDTIRNRDENMSVQNIKMGLGFTRIPTSLKLREGSYVAVQGPDQNWDWRDWVYDATKGWIVQRSDAKAVIPFNYVVFGISKC